MKAEKVQELPRLDARGKVTGQATYVEDLPDLPGMTWGAVLLSPYSHARIVSIDASTAQRLPGVLGVLDREHLEGLNPMLMPSRHALWTLPEDQPFIATDKVRFDGELVAAVVAEDFRTAQRAVELIDVEYEVLPPVFDAAEALAPGAPILYESKGTNLLLEDRLAWGEIEQGLKEADYIFEETYTSPAMFHHPMENIGVCIAQFVNDEATLWTATSSPYPVGQEIARIFSLDPDRVRVRVPYVGGHFGSKGLTGSVLAALFLARKTGRPVKMTPSAEESFRQVSRHAMVYKAKIGVKKDGTVTALDVDMILDTGAYTTGGPTTTHIAVVAAWGCYRFPHFRCYARCAYTNKVPATHTRGTGKVQTTWGIECAMDSVARQLGMDPAEFRQKNVPGRGEPPVKGALPLDTDFGELTKQAAGAIGWDGRSATDAERRAALAGPSPVVKGRSLVLSLRQGSMGRGVAYAMATIDGRGKVKIHHNAPDEGQGVYNLLRIVAARTLELPPEQIEVGLPDTAINLPFSGTVAQHTTMQMGKAVQDACENLKRELVKLACHTKGGQRDQWQLMDGYLCLGENRLKLGELVRGIGGGSTVKSIGYFHASEEGKSPLGLGNIDFYSPSAAAVEIELDRETGELRVLQYAVVADAGKALHYLSAKGQCEGGAIMGLGNALFEEVVYQDGQIINADPFQYRLAMMSDVPRGFYASMVENEDGPGPFGSKGMAQTSIVTVAPAIGNAIYDAIGVRVKSLPITPEKILAALGTWEQKRSGAP